MPNIFFPPDHVVSAAVEDALYDAVLAWCASNESTVAACVRCALREKFGMDPWAGEVLPGEKLNKHARQRYEERCIG